MALGSFIAFTPLIGLQTLIAALVATVVGASRKAAMLAVWISNPITMGPIFAFTYQLGRVLGSPESVSAGVSGRGLGGVEGSASFMSGAGMGFENLLHTGWGYMLPMLLGGAVVGLVAALMSYRLTHRGVAAYQVAYARRLRTRLTDTPSE